MRALDLFAGAGGWDIGAHALGIDPLGIELDDAACATREAAGMRTLQGDVAALDPCSAAQADVDSYVRPLDLLIASPPCFAAGTPVVTERGVLPIEDIQVGSRVLTHQGRWRRVTRTMNRVAPTVSDGLITATADHPFLSRPDRDAVAAWTRWDQVAGCRYVAIPEGAEPLSVPTIGGHELTDAFWWVVGRWLGDGWVRRVAREPGSRSVRTAYRTAPSPCLVCQEREAKRHRRNANLATAYCSGSCERKADRDRNGPTTRGTVIICCAKKEADELAVSLAPVGRWIRSKQTTTVRFELADVELAAWLEEGFGSGAVGKTLPGFVFGMEVSHRRALLDGYLSADGYTDGTRRNATTVSACLAVGFRLIATSLGLTSSLRRYDRNRDAEIEGRRINERPAYYLRLNKDDGRYTRSDGTHRWVKARKALVSAGEQTVYDISVEEDESFVAFGFVVHNCTAFSTAGKREGIKDLPLIFEAAAAMALGESLPDAGEWRDQRSALVLEPLRWALALQPDYLAWEQVPPVLEFWQLCASILRKSGYSVWTGILYAEQYGVPQTRKRAILMASKVGEVRPPRPTHQRYVSPPKEDADAPEGLFEVERAERIVRPEDRDLLPWVSMAEALGWDVPGVRFRSDAMANATERDIGEPAPTIKGGHCAAERVWFRNGNQENAAERDLDQPAPTIHFGARSNKVDWIYDRPAPTIVTTRRSDKGIVKGRQLPEGEGRNVGGRNWGGGGPSPAERPATTVAGDPRLSSPTHHNHGEQAGHAIRASLEEAAILQSFPPDYPFQGSKSQRFLQVGNAVPPALAIPILGELLGMDWKTVLFDYLATYTQPVDLQEAA